MMGEFTAEQHQGIADAIKLAKVTGDIAQKKKYALVVSQTLYIFKHLQPMPGYPALEKIRNMRDKLESLLKRTNALIIELESPKDDNAKILISNYWPWNGLALAVAQYDEGLADPELARLRTGLKDFRQATETVLTLVPSKRNYRVGYSTKDIFITCVSQLWRKANPENVVTRDVAGDFIKFAETLYIVLYPDEDPSLERAIKERGKPGKKAKDTNLLKKRPFRVP